MPRSFDTASFARGLSSSPEAMLRAGLAVLVIANVVTAGFAFHWWNDSPDALAGKVADTRREMSTQRSLLARAQAMAAKVGTAKDQGGAFVNTYMTPRRTTYSVILGELDQMAAAAGIKSREATLGQQEIEGSNDMTMLTVTAGYEGTYANLLKFMNSLDKSKRFLIIESLTVSPQSNTGNLLATLKLNTFVRDAGEDQL